MTSVRVSSNGSALGQTVTMRQFAMIADEPVELGGDDAGPAPFEWVLAGLGSCKAITIKMYADRKGWVVENVGVNVTLHSEGNRQLIRADLTLEGPLTDEQRQRLREIADRCPVHRLLTTDVEIQTVLLLG